MNAPDFPKEPASPPHKANMNSVTRAERPKLPARKPRTGGGYAEVQCPGCVAWRPSFCITRTKSEWLGDCCISALRRHGRGNEI